MIKSRESTHRDTATHSLPCADRKCLSRPKDFEWLLYDRSCTNFASREVKRQVKGNKSALPPGTTKERQIGHNPNFNYGYNTSFVGGKWPPKQKKEWPMPCMIETEERHPFFFSLFFLVVTQIQLKSGDAKLRC